MITVFAVGKRHDDWVTTGIERYQGRLRRPYDVEWQLLPHSRLDGDRARQEESERILARITSEMHVILLDETGGLLDSPAFSRLIDDCHVHSRQVVCVIGGAFGVSEELKSRANTVLSLSKLVFPHQLVRLILVEQLYRCQEISRGSGYHHV